MDGFTSSDGLFFDVNMLNFDTQDHRNKAQSHDLIPQFENHKSSQQLDGKQRKLVFISRKQKTKLSTPEIKFHIRFRNIDFPFFRAFCSSREYDVNELILVSFET